MCLAKFKKILQYLLLKYRLAAQKDYNRMWKTLSNTRNWQDFILPNRTEGEFWEEGKKQAHVLQKYVNDEDTVVDFGCGIGRVITFIKARKRIGVDVCQEFLDKINNKSIIKVKTDGRSLNAIESNSVTFLYSLMTFQHIRKKDHAHHIQEIFRILQPGGKAFIQFPKAGSTYYKPSRFVNVYSRKQLETLVNKSPFKEYKIEEGNLVGYGDGTVVNEKREYFLILEKQI